MAMFSSFRSSFAYAIRFAEAASILNLGLAGCFRSALLRRAIALLSREAFLVAALSSDSLGELRGDTAYLAVQRRVCDKPILPTAAAPSAKD